MMAYHDITIRMDTREREKNGYLGNMCVSVYLNTRGEVRKFICTTLLIILNSSWLDNW